MTRILLLDGREMSTYAIAKSLATKYEVLVGDWDRLSLSFYAPKIKRKVIYPNPELNMHDFLSWLEEFVKVENIDIVIPATEYTTIILSKNKRSIKSIVACEDYQRFLKCHDKYETVKLAAALNIPLPKSFLAQEAQEIKEFPVIIKPRMKVVFRESKAITRKVDFGNIAHSEKELSQILSKIKYQGGFIIQEYVKGFACGFECVADKGKVLSFFMHKRLHEYPCKGGVSTRLISFYDKRLRLYSEKIISKLKWTGPIMLEWKYADHPYLIEINGRYWGSLPAAVNSGIDIPKMHMSILLGENIEFPTSYPVGKVSRWFVGEILWFIDMKMAGKKPSLVGFVKDFFSIQDEVMSGPKSYIGTFVSFLRYLKEFLVYKKNMYGESK